MKIKILILVTVLVSFFFGACNKNEPDEIPVTEEKKETFNVLNPIYGKNCIGLYTLLNQKPYYPKAAGSAPKNYDLTGSVQSPQYAGEHAINLDGGDFMINGKAVTKTPEMEYRELIPDSTASSYFGYNTIFALSGNSAVGIEAFSTGIYVPAEIELSGPGELTLSKSGTNTVTWNADPKYSGNVFIKINYKGAQSNHMNPGLSDKDVIFEDAVRDKGSYSIPSSALAGMPVGGLVDITIGRGSYSEIKQKDGKIILVSAGSITYGEFTLNP